MSLASRSSKRSYRKSFYFASRADVAGFFDETDHISIDKSGKQSRTPQVGGVMNLFVNFELETPRNTVLSGSDKASESYLTLTIDKVDRNFTGGKATVKLLDKNQTGFDNYTYDMTRFEVSSVEKSIPKNVFVDQPIAFNVKPLIQEAKDRGFSTANFAIELESDTDGKITFYDNNLEEFVVSGKAEEKTEVVFGGFSADLQVVGSSFKVLPESNDANLSDALDKINDTEGVSLDIASFTFEKQTVTPSLNTKKDNQNGTFGFSGGFESTNIKDGNYQVKVNEIRFQTNDSSLTVFGGPKLNFRSIVYIDYEGVSGPNQGIKLNRVKTSGASGETRITFPTGVSAASETRNTTGQFFKLKDATKVPRLTVFKKVKR